jgi:MFS family permease
LAAGHRRESEDSLARVETPKVERSLDALNFFLADVRDGLGPYLAIYLLTEQKWDQASIGVVMSVAALAGILAQTPAGALIDRSTAKRGLMIAAAVMVTLACLTLPFIGKFELVAATQAVAGAAGAIFAPAVAAVTLGIVGPKAFAKRIGRNEAFNHAGNAVAATLAGISAYFFGPIVVFWLLAAMASPAFSRRCRFPPAPSITTRRGDLIAQRSPQRRTGMTCRPGSRCC